MDPQEHSNLSAAPIERNHFPPFSWFSKRIRLSLIRALSRVAGLFVIFAFSAVCCDAQEPTDATQTTTKPDANQIQVNWLYGAFLPRDVPLEPLNNRQRRQLYFRQTYTTWGIYAKTGLFAVGDQASNSPPDWGDGFGGYSRRFASRFGQFAVQNTFSAAGDYLLQYEPRYERCRCSGGWRRARHALVRNFVTYDKTERNIRPRIALYAGAMGAGMIASTWKPEPKDPWRNGYQSVLTQAVFGCLSNVIGEFAPDILKKLGRK